MGVEYLVCQDKTLFKEAEEMAAAASVSVISEIDEAVCEKGGFFLFLDDKGLWLRKYGDKNPGVSVDFFSSDIVRRISTSSLKDPLSRAVGLNKNKDLFVLDATAGLGKDSFFLYILGAKVAGFEKNKIVYALLKRGFELYCAKKNWESSFLPNLAFFNINSESFLLGDLERNDAVQSYFRFVGSSMSDLICPDVIYMDPMYPPKRKKSAKSKKGISYLQELLGYSRQESIFTVPWQNTAPRLVVKRPVHAPLNPCGEPPSYSISSKLVRYDVYLRR